MKRITLFLFVNLAAVSMLTAVAALICAAFGVDLSAIGGAGDFVPLLAIAFIFGMAGALISLALSKTMVKATMKCRIVDGSEGPAERWLVSTVADLASRAGVGMPEVAIYPGEANAFATGARRDHALVAVSTRIMEQMSESELKAVLGHEMSHVANGDMVTMCLAQGVVNTFVIFFSHILAGIVQTTVNSNRRGERRRSGGGNWFLYHMLLQLFQTVFGLLAAMVLMWYSRKREFAADAGSARLLGSPSPMIAALRRLGNLRPGVLPDSIKAFGISGGKTSLFASHPSMEDRISALMNLPPDFAV
ncbi:MAG: protease HtpX [Kiritimatiellae bacterium]|nr:protease HtpX [Kiritimatiellia bacterium]